MQKSNLCLHCLTKNPDSQSDFCCLGCKNAYEIINKHGLNHYYDIYTDNASNRKVDQSFSYSSSKIPQISTFTKNGVDIYSARMFVAGVKCGACIWLIERILKKHPNIVTARLNFTRGILLIEWGGDKNLIEEFIATLDRIGYNTVPADDATIKEKEEEKHNTFMLKCLAVSGFGAGNVMLFSIGLWFYGVELGEGTKDLLQIFSLLIGMPVILYSSRPFFHSAIKSLKLGRSNMDLPICIAIVLASAFSIFSSLSGGEHIYFDSVVMLIFFLMIGKYTQIMIRRKVLKAVSQSSSFSSKFARVLDESGSLNIINSSDIKKGDILLVPVGEKIAADGIIIESETEVDSSMITGESEPKPVSLGDMVYAESLNVGKPFKLRVTKTRSESVFSEIAHLAEKLELSSNKYTKIADKVARIYTPLIHVLALITFIFWAFFTDIGIQTSILYCVAVLIITCPCALALATPVAQSLTVLSLLKNGILVKSADSIEAINQIDTVIFDKTGTITDARLNLIDIFEIKDGLEIPICEQDTMSISSIASLVSQSSIHPLSQSIVRFNKDLIQKKNQKTESLQSDIQSIVEYRSIGLRSIYKGNEVRIGKRDFCEVENSYINNHKSKTCFMSFDGRFFIFIFEDKIKPDANLVISKLAAKKRVILLSGDNYFSVKRVAEEVGISQYLYDQTPQSKAEFIQSLRSEGKKILMIGDGINDAPSLSLSDVSMSFTIGASIAQNAADIIVGSDKLQHILDVFSISKNSINIMKQNLILSLLYNSIAVSIAMLGYVNPLIAAISMSFSSILVVLNSSRMNK